MSYLEIMNGDTGLLPYAAGQALGKELANTYQAALPYPHVVIDDFLPPALLDNVLNWFEAEKTNNNNNVIFDRAQEKFKSNFQPDSLSSEIRQLFYSFNSRPFIKILENITGIKGLIPDPHFLGAGIHEIKQGGHLSIHADFNHHLPMNLERRINVLVYLNKKWQLEYGGALELWDESMNNCVQTIVPIFNRCVIFNTTSNSQHGNPQPIAHPEGISRKSIALYYYTSTWDGTKRSHTTQFQVRPGSTDRRDWRVKIREVKDDLLPPILARRLRI